MNAILSAVERILAEQQRMPCHCHAYPFPHRVGGGLCHEPFPIAERGLHYRGQERDADMRRMDLEAGL